MENSYIIGGIAEGYLMVPDLDNFKRFCNKNINGNWMYMDKLFKDEDLMLITFPAYFYLNTSSDKESLYWRKTSAESCSLYVRQDIENYKQKVQILEEFQATLNQSQY